MFQQPTTSDQRPIRAVVARILDFQEVSKAHSSGAPVFFCERAGIEPARVRCSRLEVFFPPYAVESLQAESRELLLMIGKSINTASARMQGKAIGA